jgi:flavodoxin/ferredoxin
MKKCLIVYFSQGGATARTAEAIAAGLGEKGHQVDLHNLNGGTPPGPEGYDSLGIGLPVYIFRPPFRVLDYLKGLPELEGLPFFVFLTYGTLPGSAGTVVRKALARKGGEEKGYFKARGADYYLGYLQQGYLFSPDNPTPLELKDARDFGKIVADRLSGARYIKPVYEGPPSIVYRMETFFTHRLIVKWMYSRLFYVKSKKCTACGQCMKVCPTGNISENGKGRPVWGRDCLLCLYCEMKCPADAILSPASWPLFLPFIAYNVWKARGNASIDRARVVHARGRTKRAGGA